MVKYLPAVWETWVQSLGWEDPLEKRTENGYPFQYSGLENSMDRRALQATVYGVAKSQMSNFHFQTVTLCCLLY